MREWKTGIDIVVVNYRTPGDLQEFLDSFVEWKDDINTYLWIVNVDPEAADERVARKFLRMHSNTTLLEHRTNVGYARAVNDAAARGCRELIGIFNADTQFTPGSLEDCYFHLLHHEDWGVLGPRQVNEKGQITHAGIFGSLSDPKHRGWREGAGDKYKDIEEAVTVSGSAYFVKRKMWEELTSCPTYRGIAPKAEGAFLPTPHYYEETWCSYHAQAHGWKVMYFGQATMIHKWHKASEVGGFAEKSMPVSQELFRKACANHGIDCD